jgi:hypothetical protein
MVGTGFGKSKASYNGSGEERLVGYGQANAASGPVIGHGIMAGDIAC